MPQSGGYVGVTRNEGLKRCMMLLVLADLRGFPPPPTGCGLRSWPKA